MLALPVGLGPVALDGAGVGVDHDDALGSVDEDGRAVRNGEHVRTGADDGWYPERAGEDRAVGDRAAGRGDDAEDRAGVESRRLGRCQVGCHDDAREGGSRPGGGADEVAQDLVADGADVRRPGPEVGVGELVEALGERVHGDAPGVLRHNGIAGDDLERGTDELIVVEEEQVGVEDLGLVGSGGASHVVSGRAELGTGRFEGDVQPFGLHRGRAGSGARGCTRPCPGASTWARCRCRATPRSGPRRSSHEPRRRRSSARRSSAVRARRSRRALRGLGGRTALTSIWSPFGTPSVESALTLRPLTVGTAACSGCGR